MEEKGVGETLKISVIGNGAWGSALADVARRRGHAVVVWGRKSRVKGDTTDLKEALTGAECVILSVPSHAMREVCLDLKKNCSISETLLVSVAKGIEEKTGLRMTPLISECTGSDRVLTLSGPSFAEEVARGLPAALVCASAREDDAKQVQHALSGEDFRIYTNNDTAGVELGGSLKNVMAIAAGAAAGLGLGVNAQAALITRGMSELVKVGVVLGGESRTFYGLSGLGDLILTCSSSLSRNRQVGEALARSNDLQTAIASIKGTAEGVRTARSVHQLIIQRGIEAPILSQVYAILYENKPVLDALRSLMIRDLKPEF